MPKRVSQLPSEEGPLSTGTSSPPVTSGDEENVNVPAVAVPVVGSPTFVVYKRRFVVLALFCLSAFVNQAMNLTFPNIIRQSQELFDTKPFWINMLPIVSNVIAIVLGIPTCEVFSRKGLRFVLVSAALLNLVCAGLRLIAAEWYPQFWMLAVSQFAVGAAQLVSRSAPSLVAATWFPETERGMATTAGVLALYFGMGAGYFLPPALVNPTHKAAVNFVLLFGIHFALSVVAAVATVLTVPRAPPTPPSATSPEHTKTEEPPTDESENSASNVFRLLWQERKNASFVTLSVVNGLVLGLTATAGALLFQLLSPFGVTEVDAGYVLAGGILLGAGLSTGLARLVDKTRKYKRIIVIGYGFFGLVCAGMGVMMFVVADAAAVGITSCVLNVLLTIALVPMIPMSLEMAVEVTYPLPEVISASAVMWLTSFFAVASTVILAAAIGEQSSVTISAVWMLVEGGIVFLGAVAIAVAVVEENRRVAAEKEHQTGKKVVDEQTNLLA